MKLAAAAILSLVAIATYASPAAYSENPVNAEYSAADESVIVHLEKRTGKQPRFMERIEEIQNSVNHNHHRQDIKAHNKDRLIQDKISRQQRQQEEYQRQLQDNTKTTTKTCLFKTRLSKDMTIKYRLIQDMIIKDNKDYYKNNNKNSEKKSIKDIKNNKGIKTQRYQEEEYQRQRQRGLHLQQQRLLQEQHQRLLQKRLQEQQRRQQEQQQRLQESGVKYQRPKSPEGILQDWKKVCLLNPDLYEYRDGKFICPEYIHDKKRPDFVKPSEEILAQLGTTNQPMDARVKSWKEMGDGKSTTQEIKVWAGILPESRR
ncbi:hypothetical protein BASA62_007965 [Batrachochytrium salamandrivorans]|nr:hypothetical protein BASA62_007965 [Batrachochytrium salamandrivorans]